MVSKRGERAWICECGTLAPRKKGDPAILCVSCGKKMKKGRKPVEEIKAGKLTTNIKKDHPKHEHAPQSTRSKDRSKKYQQYQQPEGNQSATLLRNFRLYIEQTRYTADHKTWWTAVFPTTPYPPSSELTSRVLIALKIEYELAKRNLEEENKPISTKFALNYQAAMSLDKTKLTPTLRTVIESYEGAVVSRKAKADKKEERERKLGKLNMPKEEKE